MENRKSTNLLILALGSSGLAYAAYSYWNRPEEDGKNHRSHISHVGGGRFMGGIGVPLSPGPKSPGSPNNGVSSPSDSGTHRAGFGGTGEGAGA